MELQKQVSLKRLSIEEAFKKLDKNGDDFVTVDEFWTEIEQFISLSEYFKRGLFSYFDLGKQGMFDLHRFTQVMERITLRKNPAKEDNWSWQQSVLI